jgi:hypothetical protein
MKKFTLIFAVVSIAFLASAQDNQGLQERFERAKAISSRHSMLTSHMINSTSSSAKSIQNNVLLKSINAIQKLDSVVYKELSQETENWENSSKDEYQYDAQLNNTVQSELEWKNKSWHEVARTDLVFTDNNLISYMDMYYEDVITGQLVLENRMVAFHNAEGKLDSVHHKVAVTEDSLALEIRQIYHYNTSGLLVQMDMIIIDDSDEEDSLLKMTYVYTYGDDDRLEKFTIMYIEGELQIVSSETKYIYDGSGKRIASELSNLNWMTFTLEPEYRSDYEYNTAGNVSVETYSMWNNVTETWIEEEKDEYTYNNISFSEVIFPSYMLFWGLFEETNIFMNAITEIHTFYKQAENWVETERTTFYYSEATPSNANQIARPMVSVYPNPASDEITFTWQGYNQLILEIYSITGAKLIGRQISSGMQVPVYQLNDGVYLYKLLNNKQTLHSGKLIKK